MKKLTEELKQKIFEHVSQGKGSAEGPRQEYLRKWLEAYKYKNLELPATTFVGEQIPKYTTPYVEPVLRECIKEALPQLLDSFTSDKRLAVSFRSRGWDNNQKRNELITNNINKIFLDEQDGYAVIEKTINEALNVGSAFNKVFVDEKTTHERATVPDWLEITEFMGMLADGWQIDPPAELATDKKGKVSGFEWKTEVIKGTDPQTGQDFEQSFIVIKGTIPLMKYEAFIKSEFVELRDLWFDVTNGDDFSKSRYMCQRILTTVGEAELKGYDPEIIKGASLEEDDFYYTEATDYLGTVGSFFDNNSVDEKERKINLYEHYIYSSLLDEKAEVKKYQIIATGTEIIEVNEISFFPFVHCKKEIVIGDFFGRGFFDDAKPYQIALTKKARQAEANADRQTYGRYLAVQGQYNRESLLNNRPGAVIEQKAPGAVDRMPEHELGQGFTYSYEKLQESADKSLRRGFGSANLEEIPPIATATVAMGVYQDAQRGMMLSKTIARTYLNPLFCLVYETMRAENWPLQDDTGQNVQGVELPAVYDLSIDVQTKGDDAAQVMQLQVINQTAQMLGQIQASYISDQNKYEMLKFMCKSADLDATQFLTDPSQLKQDPAKEEMQKENEAIQHVATKHQLQSIILNNWKIAAEINELEQKADNEISGQAIKHEESLANIQAIMMTAQNEADKNDVKREEIKVKDKAVNYETILAAQKHAADLTTPRINGVR